jgi:hypothetical protein
MFKKPHSCRTTLKVRDFTFDVDYSYFHEEGRMYLSNGDPGYPGYEEININHAYTSDDVLDIIAEYDDLVRVYNTKREIPITSFELLEEEIIDAVDYYITHDYSPEDWGDFDYEED